MIFFKSVSEQIFTHMVMVHLHIRINGHDISDKGKITKWYSSFHGVGRNAAVSTQYIIHVQFTYSLFSFLLKAFCIRGKVCILVAEQFVGNFTGKQHFDICVFMDVFT